MKPATFCAIAFLCLLTLGSSIGSATRLIAPLPPQPPPGGWIETPVTRIPAEYAGIILGSAYEAGVPGWMFARLIEKESGYKAHALRKNRNGTFDRGIAQFNSRYMADFYWFDNDGKEFDPMKPHEALPVAARYLRRLYDATGDWWMAAAAYECGLTAVREGRVPERTARAADFVTGRDER